MLKRDLLNNVNKRNNKKRSVTPVLYIVYRMASVPAVLRRVLLKPMEPEYEQIMLKNGKNIIGRNIETGIDDVKCSRKQLEFNVNLNEGKVNMKVLGVNPSGINGLMALKDSKFDLQHGDVIEIVYSKHPFEVTLNPPPPNNDDDGMDVESPEKNVEISNNPPSEQNSVKFGSWEAVENGKMLLLTSPGMKASNKIAGYDLDGTIIKTKSGNVFPKTIDDWQIIFPQVASKLKLLFENDYKICFFTNQAGISKGKLDAKDFKHKIVSILKKLGVPVQVFVATGNGFFRKPLTGMWEHLVSNCNEGIKIDLAQSFFVGDAAGRPESGKGPLKRKKDHSCVDRYFASNVGITFYTPEEHFLGKNTEQWTKPDFEPKELHDKLPLLEPETAKLSNESCELIVMVGLPGSGKSHFARENLKQLGYQIVNADTLGGVAACLKACENALKSQKSCVVDNTNVDADSRKKFIELAKKFNVECRGFVMNVSLSHVKHNVAFRQLTDNNHAPINDMVMNMMKKKYTFPTLDEGFSEIVKVNIQPTFKCSDHEKLYKMYLVEK